MNYIALGRLIDIQYCLLEMPSDPECPIPPRFPPLIIKKLPTQSPLDLVIALTPGRDSPHVIGFYMEIYANEKRVFARLFNYKEELSKVMPEETILLTFDAKADFFKELKEHFVAGNGIRVFAISNDKTSKGKTSKITVFSKKALSGMMK